VREHTGNRFSSNHAFSQAQVEQAAQQVASEHRGKRLLMNVTMAHRALALRQSIVTTVLGALAMISLYVSEQTTPTLDHDTLTVWALATCANIVLRAGINLKLFTARAPITVLSSAPMRLLPLLVVVLAAIQWIWSIELFVSQPLGTNEFILFVGLLGVSVAVLGMWPAVPIAVFVYLATTWPPFFLQLYQTQTLPLWALGMVASSVALILWACVYVHLKQVQTILDRSDEIDLLVARLHSANVELNSANSTLATLRNEAASELTARSLFFSSASHDFGQRLHAMKLLAHSSMGAVADRRVEIPALHRLADAIEDVQQYVNDVLDFARFDGVAPTPDRRDVDLQHLFQQLELNFEDVACAKNVTVIFRSTDVVLWTDPSMLRRMLENLVSNAIKFSSARVLVAARRRSSGIAIEVWDQGPGIAASDHKIIFVPFRQTANDAGRSGGVGLGLAIVKRFADCLGYQVTVHSKLGRGTVMTIIVPRHAMREQADARDVAPAAGIASAC
jgi:signal transduction histidine kinase